MQMTYKQCIQIYSIRICLRFIERPLEWQLKTEWNFDFAVYYMKIQLGHAHHLLWLRAAVSVPYAEHLLRFKVTDVSHTWARTGQVLLLLLLRTFSKNPQNSNVEVLHLTNEVKGLRALTRTTALLDSDWSVYAANTLRNCNARFYIPVGCSAMLLFSNVGIGATGSISI